jgi:hypothetical protein
MAESTVGVDEGTDKYLHTMQRTISATAKEDQYVLDGEPAAATYVAIAKTIVTTTSASHILFLMGDGTNYCRMRRLFVRQVVAAGAATLAELSIFRLSTAGSGGGAITARPYDSADAAFGGTIQTLPSSKGTEGVELWHDRLWLTNSIAAQPNSVEWVARPGQKPIIWGSATTDGIALKIVTGIATSTLDVMVEFTNLAYL